jgi:hypothetical protein
MPHWVSFGKNQLTQQISPAAHGMPAQLSVLPPPELLDDEALLDEELEAAELLLELAAVELVAVVSLPVELLVEGLPPVPLVVSVPVMVPVVELPPVPGFEPPNRSEGSPLPVQASAITGRDRRQAKIVQVRRIESSRKAAGVYQLNRLERTFTDTRADTATRS